MPKLIIFDNDGVLIDSEIVWHKTKKAHPNAPLHEINLLTEGAYEQELRPIEGIKEVIEYVDQQKIQKCIASNGDTEYVLRTLKLTHLDKYFRKGDIISLSIVPKPKPAPDLFLYAAWLFDAQPSECLVIEDHPLGVHAAHAAQMPVIGFLGASHSQSRSYREDLEASKPMAIIGDASELLEYLKLLA